MKRFDRTLGILLLLRSGKTLSASALARRFEVSARTIYRDIETLSGIGVPIYAEHGSDGGFRLLAGHFLPPVTLSLGEATALLTGLALLRRLRARPFPLDLAAAGAKLLAALPEHLRSPLEDMQQIIGFEATPYDSFHPERGEPAQHDQSQAETHESQVITTFLQCILDGATLTIDYRSHSPALRTFALAPLGLLWDRDRWYLVGQRLNQDEAPRMWRADRVHAITRQAQPSGPRPPFAISQLLGRQWLSGAMAEWASRTPVVIRITPTQAELLRRDWYYCHAVFSATGAGQVSMTIGEVDQALVFALLRWLGPGAELVAPVEWRSAFVADVQALLAPYTADPAEGDCSSEQMCL